jgi:hypothetical protein
MDDLDEAIDRTLPETLGIPASAPLGDSATRSGDLSGMRQGPSSAVESPSGLTWADRDRLQTEMGDSSGAAIECAISYPTPRAKGQGARCGPAPGRLARQAAPTDP